MGTASDEVSALRAQIEAIKATLGQVPALRGELAAIGATVAAMSAELRRVRDAGRVDVLDDGTVTRAEAAKMLGMTASALKSMATRREGPAFKIFRGKAFYREADLRAWRAQQIRRGARDRPRGADLKPCAPELPL
jgi:hypothetical protein